MLNFSGFPFSLDLYDGTNAADNDVLSLGLAPIYNTLTSNGFKNNRYYTSIYLFTNQLLQHLPSASRATTQSRLNALLRRHTGVTRSMTGWLAPRRRARLYPVGEYRLAGVPPVMCGSVTMSRFLSRRPRCRGRAGRWR